MWKRLVLVLLVAASTLQADDREATKLATLRRASSEKRALAAHLVAEAHAALDARDFERSIALVESAQVVTRELQRLESETSSLVAAVVSEAVPALDDDRFEVREAATLRLMRLGPRARESLLAASRGERLGTEARARMGEVLRVIAAVDDDGRFHQWAVTATASSEYTDGDWSAMQATGEPNTLACGDLPTAWASKEPNAGPEWLELTYGEPVRPVAVRIRETFNPGAIVKVEARDGNNAWHTLWQGNDATAECPGWLSVECAAPEWRARTIKVTLDTTRGRSWCEIDAVGLVGEWDTLSGR
ncbi:MAG TPA: hypothetical protein VFF73_20440 [Planctomycetota bacterium]|nr:hypothetical protein [Planctomycetota bacterium]